MKRVRSAQANFWLAEADNDIVIYKDGICPDLLTADDASSVLWACCESEFRYQFNTRIPKHPIRVRVTIERIDEGEDQ
jgi:hypothetical protein